MKLYEEQTLNTLLGGRYKIRGMIGRGGMSKVYLAETNDMLRILRAIKQINLQKVPSLDLLKEARILKELEHEAIPRIIEIKETKTDLLIVQEYVSGSSLYELLQKEKKFNEKVVLEWARQICNVLDYLHKKNIIHRDIKPANVILTNEGKIKLIDFGIAGDL